MNKNASTLFYNFFTIIYNTTFYNSKLSVKKIWLLLHCLTGETV